MSRDRRESLSRAAMVLAGVLMLTAAILAGTVPTDVSGGPTMAVVYVLMGAAGALGLAAVLTTVRFDDDERGR